MTTATRVQIAATKLLQKIVTDKAILTVLTMLREAIRPHFIKASCFKVQHAKNLYLTTADYLNLISNVKKASALRAVCDPEATIDTFALPSHTGRRSIITVVNYENDGDEFWRGTCRGAQETGISWYRC